MATASELNLGESAPLLGRYQVVVVQQPAATSSDNPLEATQSRGPNEPRPSLSPICWLLFLSPTPSEGPGQPPTEGPDATALTNAQVHTGFFVGFMKRFRIMMGFLDARRRYMWEQSIPSFLLLLFGISQFGMEDFLNLLFPSAVP
ncbi:hypothetical protein L486_04716 [Kwoniella mangroviensis CBS 10435]|uniref:Uncharacterized protein n=1 Tax=Kwoniella mangroviensis CBS 10435 TaxID=1331196 RepID=A0A1B9IPE4_9TREE|nr:hypothetical protein L486_04716 [Kwoniella mangroviensis CBS 10435]